MKKLMPILIYSISIGLFIWVMVRAVHRSNYEMAGIFALLLSLKIGQWLVNKKFSDMAMRLVVFRLWIWLCILLAFAYAFIRFYFFIPADSVWAACVLMLLGPVYSEYRKSLERPDTNR